MTEDYYVANKLMKGFIGSGNIDTNSRLCMSTAVPGYKRAFGEDVVPCCYDDLKPVPVSAGGDSLTMRGTVLPLALVPIPLKPVLPLSHESARGCRP